MTREEFEAVLKWIHPDLGWNYGASKSVAGIVLRDGKPNPVKMLVLAGAQQDALPRLIGRFEREGINI